MGKTANQTSKHVGIDPNESETMRERLLNGDAKVPEEILSDRDLNLQSNAEHNSVRKKKRSKKQKSTRNPLQNNVIDHDLQEVTSMTPSIQEGNMCNLDCSLKTVQETTKFEGLDTRLGKKRRKNRKRKHNVLNSNDTHHDHVEGSLMKNTSLEQDSFQPLLVEKRLEADSDTTQYCAKVNLFLDTNREQEQSKRHNPSESNNSSSKTDDKYSVKVDGNPVSAVAEPDCSHERCLDSILTRKHDDFVEANVVSPETGNIKTYKRKKRVKTYRRKKGKASKSLGNSLEFSEEGAGSPELVVQDKMEDTSLDHLNEAVVSGNSISMSEIDAVVCQTTQMKQLSQVVENLSINKESDGCTDGKPVSKESKKSIATETLNETTNEGSIEIIDSVVEIVVEHSEQANRGKIDVIQNAVQDASVGEENFSESTSFKDDNSVIGVSGTDLSSNLLDKKILEGKSEIEEPISSSSQLSEMKDDVSLAISKEEHSLQVVQSSPERALMVPFRKKLLILDVNGLLADIVLHISYRYRADTIIGNKAVFKRPFCDDFLQFCFERFNVGVWSSRTRRNVQLVLDFLMGENQKNLLFCWDQSHCTDTGYNTVENRDKPLLLKVLKKLWEKNEQNLPWERGEYNESNTLLLDDSPYKALCNPPNTAIFPHTYWYKDVKDNSLGPGGDLRVYLGKLAIAENVQKYVEQNPFGQRPITERNLSWAFYLKVISTVSSHYESKET